MKRILHFIHGLNIGGAETFLSNLIQNSPSDFEYHFAIQNKNITNPFFLTYIENKNGILHILPDFTSHPISQYFHLKKLLKYHEFDCIHIHMNALINPIPLIAPINSRTQVIIHSHSSSNNSGGRMAKLIHYINRTIFLNKKQKYVACSNIAGNWMFNEKQFLIINNAVFLDDFQYKKEDRNFIRKKYLIEEDTIIIGTVARLVNQKNIAFLIYLFNELLSKKTNSKLLIVGEGPERGNLEVLAKKLRIESEIIFAGNQFKPTPYYSAMDFFIMPSFFEGLGFTAIEAQASGLPVITSDKVPADICISPLVAQLPLESTYSLWVNKILELLEQTKEINRIDVSKYLKGSNFDISVQQEKILSLYSQ